MSALTLAQIRTEAQRAADMVDTEIADESQRFVTDSEWTDAINASAARLYGLLVTSFEDFRVRSDQFSSVSSDPFYIDQATYMLPADFLKLRGLDVQWAGSPTGWFTLKSIPFASRNDQWYPTAPTWLVPGSCRYMLVDNTIIFAPQPQGTTTFRRWYVPTLPALAADSDKLDLGPVNGWEQYIILDAAIKKLQKEESFEAAQVLMARLQQFEAQVKSEAKNRDAGGPKHVSLVRDDGVGALSNRWGGFFGR